MNDPNFLYAFERTMLVEVGATEDGHVNRTTDRGGETKYGISKRAFPNEDIANLTLERAQALAFEHYWKPAGLAAIEDKFVAAEIFDSCYLHGPTPAGRIAQRACTFLGRPVTVDGKLGPKSAEALNVLSKRYRLALLEALNLFQGVYFLEICEHDPGQLANARGWMKRLTVPAEVLEV